MGIFANEMLGFEACEWFIFAEKKLLWVNSTLSHGEVTHYWFESRGESREGILIALESYSTDLTQC